MQMQFLRSFTLLLTVALAGCAEQPVTYYAAPTAAAMPGIDNMVYGMTAQPAPAASGLYMAAQYPTAQYPMAQYPSPHYQAAPVVPYAAGPYGMAPYAPAPAVAAVPYATPSRAPLYGYAAPIPEGHYTLDSGDRLRIVVFGQDGLTNSYIVSAGGHIDMPLIGAVMARGATTEQLAGRISEKLRDGFIREPHVAVEIEAYRPFFILGEVTAPGQYPYVANMTAETAVAIAGGFTPRAFRKTIVLNRNYYGRLVRMAVPLTFPLHPGDTINVQERWF